MVLGANCIKSVAICKKIMLDFSASFTCKVLAQKPLQVKKTCKKPASPYNVEQTA